MEKISSSMLQALILTKDEEPNIARVLNKLQWLERVVVLDSFSTDTTIELIKSFPNVELHQRAFDTFGRQWNFGLNLVRSEWVLNLDADYVLPDNFINELQKLIFTNDKDINAYNSNFKFLIYGKKLIGNNTTPRSVLFRRTKGYFYDDGHTQRLKVEGKAGNFKHAILHDDRKSLSRWLSNQDSYSIKECNKLLDPTNKQSKSTINKIRKTKIFAPILVFFYCAFYKGILLNGWVGWYYILQRTMVEMLWALRLIENEKFDIKPSDIKRGTQLFDKKPSHEIRQPIPRSLSDHE